MDSVLTSIVTVFSWLVFFSGTLLNVSAYYSIVKMGAFVGQLSALQIAWTTFRDLGNLALLFGFIAMGIATILDSASYSAKKKLVALVIVAIAINFSSLVARGIIDTGNIIAIQFYKAYNSGNIPPDGNFNDAGISNKFMEAVSLQTLYKEGKAGSSETDSTEHSGSQSLVISFMSIILFIVVSFVFFSLAFLFIARFVILIFLITISPLAFAAFVIPSFAGKGKEWFNVLLKNTFVAPLVMLLLLVSVNMTTSIKDIIVPSATSGYATLDGGSWPNILLTFSIISGFFIASLLIAKQLSAFGANWAMKMGAGAAALPFILPGRWVQRRAGSALQGYNALAGRSRVAGNVLRFSGIDAGINKSLTSIQKSKIGPFASSEEAKKARDARRIEQEHAASGADQKRRIRDASQEIAAAEANLKAAKDKETPDPVEIETAQKALATGNANMARALQGMSGHDLEETVKMASPTVMVAISKNVSPEAFENLMKNKDVPEDVKHTLQGARFADISASDPASLKSLRNMKMKDLEQLAKADPEKFEAIVKAENKDDNLKSYLTEDQLDTLAKSNVLSAQQSEHVRSNRAAGRVEQWMSDPNRQEDAAAIVRDMTSKDKMKLKAATLATASVAHTLTPEDLNAIVVENKMSSAQKEAVKNHILSKPANDPQRVVIEKSFEDNKFGRSLWGWPAPAAASAASTV